MEVVQQVLRVHARSKASKSVEEVAIEYILWMCQQLKQEQIL